jgi:hypothetical protein
MLFVGIEIFLESKSTRTCVKYQPDFLFGLRKIEFSEMSEIGQKNAQDLMVSVLT